MPVPGPGYQKLRAAPFAPRSTTRRQKVTYVDMGYGLKSRPGRSLRRRFLTFSIWPRSSEVPRRHVRWPIELGGLRSTSAKVFFLPQYIAAATGDPCPCRFLTSYYRRLFQEPCVRACIARMTNWQTGHVVYDQKFGPLIHRVRFCTAFLAPLWDRWLRSSY